MKICWCSCRRNRPKRPSQPKPAPPRRRLRERYHILISQVTRYHEVTLSVTAQNRYLKSEVYGQEMKPTSRVWPFRTPTQDERITLFEIIFKLWLCHNLTVWNHVLIHNESAYSLYQVITIEAYYLLIILRK